jgi:plastocyanin
MRRARRWVVVAVGLLVAACGGVTQTSGASTFIVRAGEVGEGSPPDLGLFEFYVSRLRVHAGDRIRFDNGSGAISVPHTVTFSDKPDQMPPPVLPEVGQVPLAWAQCVAPQGLPAGTTECPDGSRTAFPPTGTVITLPAFTGKGYYNSGIFDGGQAVEVPIAEDISPGSYTFVCYLHPTTMDLEVDVVPEDQPTQTQADLDLESTRQVEVDVGDGLAAERSAALAARPPGTVQAGSEQGKAVVMRFFPVQITVPVGSAVTWINNGSDPHVVAFGRAVGPHDAQNFAQPSLASGSEYTGGFAISGAIGAGAPSQVYALRFPKPGRYAYICPIHPGMAGMIEVV